MKNVQNRYLRSQKNDISASQASLKHLKLMIIKHKTALLCSAQTETCEVCVDVFRGKAFVPWQCWHNHDWKASSHIRVLGSAHVSDLKTSSAEFKWRCQTWDLSPTTDPKQQRNRPNPARSRDPDRTQLLGFRPPSPRFPVCTRLPFVCMKPRTLNFSQYLIQSSALRLLIIPLLNLFWQLIATKPLRARS